MDIEVKFDGEEIIVTRPGTDFMLAYRKRPNQPEPDPHAKLDGAYDCFTYDQRVPRASL